ncbi:hypothetical protein [Roseomonas genomospecies 6]|uniref:Uncharacterized protein n=1 Tax=Roseomonas genomospecies 6 TaxID=214106 RepID=A0A9W7NKR6_9PROT|nr:hypothetical protein [Roseomonas genomospecies 6]KAA0681534.1 hypothetical protein DS843_10860 [Roseomonas genomospecies 6]
MIVGLAMMAIGMAMLFANRGRSGRSVRAKSIGGNVYMGDVNIGSTITHNAPPPPAKRGFFEWSGWLLSAGGFVLSVISVYPMLFPIKP